MPATFGYAKQKTFVSGKPKKARQGKAAEELPVRGRCFQASGGEVYDRKGHGWYGKKAMPDDTPTDRSMGGYNTQNGYGFGAGDRIPLGRAFMPLISNMGVAGRK